MQSTPTAEIPVAIVGCGAISRFFYVPSLHALAGPAGLRVAALVDPSSENVGRLAEEFPEAKSFKSIEEAQIGAEHLVIVASPPKFHASKRGGGVM